MVQATVDDCCVLDLTRKTDLIIRLVAYIRIRGSNNEPLGLHGILFG